MLTLATLWGATPVLAQNVTAHTLTDTVSVGERFFITLSAEHNGVAEAAFPDPAAGDSAFGDVVLLRRHFEGQRRPDPGNPDVRVDSVVYEAAAFGVDSAYVAPLPVRFTTPGRTYTVGSQPFVLPVRTTAPEDATEILDLAPLVPFRRPWWHWALVALGILLTAGLFAWLVRRHFRKEPVQPAPAAPARAGTPYEQAEERLRVLEHVDLSRPEAVKPFYVALSDLLRTYLSQRLGVPALELTTRELLDRLARPSPDAPSLVLDTARLRGILSTADLVKFADAQPEPGTGQNLIAETRALLRDMETAFQPVAEANSTIDVSP